MLILAGVLLLNLVISWWNAVQAGRCWIETKSIGGFSRLLTWSAAIQSAVGFTMIIAFGLAWIASLFHWLPPKGVEALLNLEYVLIIVPAIGSGLVILIHSWQMAFRDRSIANLGGAAYNTLAMGHNIYSAATELPSIFDSLGNLGFSGDSDGDSDDNGSGVVGLIVVFLALIALAGGILCTWAIIRHSMGSVPIQDRKDSVPAG